MGHPEDHHHHHHHHNDSHSEHQTEKKMPFGQKARKLLEHWMHHNEAHAADYQKWAEEFTRNELKEAAALLTSAARATADINHTLAQALSNLEAEK